MDQTDISFKEVCRRLGKSRQTVYSHLNKLSIQTHKKGKQAYIFQEEFERVQQSVKESSIDSQPYNKTDTLPDTSEKFYEDNKEKSSVNTDTLAVKALTDQLTIKDRQLSEKDKQIDSLLTIQKADKSMLAGYQKKFGALEAPQTNDSMETPINQKWWRLKVPLWVQWGSWIVLVAVSFILLFSNKISSIFTSII